MLRWPPNALLAGPGRMRLATLMTGRPLSVDDLQQRSGESLTLCRTFFDDLTKLDLLLPAPAAALLPLERATHITAANQLVFKKNPAQPGMLARMRLHLGLGNMSASGKTYRA